MREVVLRAVAVLAVVSGLVVASPYLATGDSDHACTRSGCTVSASDPPDSGSNDAGTQSNGVSASDGSGLKSTTSKKTTDLSERNKARIKHYLETGEVIGTDPIPCVSLGNDLVGTLCPLPPVDPDRPGEPATPAISPGDAAIIATAQLGLRPGQPKIGPDPSINRWKIAAVGYPMWLWAEGNLDPRPVSKTVQGLTVSLDASLRSMTYDLGDGSTLRCGKGTPWSRGAGAGVPSPTCGYAYQKASLPEGPYTITATTSWRVAWTAGGESGVIDFKQTATTQIPVGELQVLTR